MWTSNSSSRVVSRNSDFSSLEPAINSFSNIIKMEKPLVVESVYMYEKENAKSHHTINFEIVHLEPPTSVLRRGQTFSMVLRFNRKFDEKADVVKLIFNFGPYPSAMKGTKGLCTVINKKEFSFTDLKTWGIRIVGVYENDLSLEVISPSDSPIGIWNLDVETNLLGREKTSNKYSHKRDIYLLFNPWVKGDQVYMEEEQLLNEYVLNDVGKIWVGSYGSERGREWVFGQFDACVLPACQLLLDRSRIRPISRGDPVKMARAISRIVNANDDQGVLVGAWRPPYLNGTAPSAWTGSAPILEEFLETRTEVRYGQCWVFAGVVTTVCRALGIPSRVVTNMVSAHDTNSSLSVDIYYDANNIKLEDNPIDENAGNDSLWNFHVWNDVWMARPDLPKGYGGWQAIDATPQEISDDTFQCGPAPLEAVKEGVVGYNYDISFILASVNADLLRWKEDPESELGYSKIESNKYHVGRIILTKAPFVFDPKGDSDREDITHLYKAKEGTEAERLTLYRAVRSIDIAKQYYSLPTQEKEDVVFELVDITKINIGDPFSVIVKIENKSSETRTIKVILSVGSVYYTGIKAKEIKSETGEFVLKPHESEKLRLKVAVEEYLYKLVEYCIMKLDAIASVVETKQTWADEDDFQVIKPTIDVQIEGEPTVGRPSRVTLSFKNPLKMILKNCRFNYAAPGLLKNQMIEYRDVQPEEFVRIEHQVVPRKPGPQKIVATFTSEELTDITGSAAIDVLDENE